MDFNKPFNLNQLMETHEHCMVDVYLRDGLRGIDGLLKLIETQKQYFKHLIKERTGKNLRKTPRRGNKLVALENRLCAINVVFENEEDKDLISRSGTKTARTPVLKTNAKFPKTPEFFNTPTTGKCRTLKKSSNLLKLNGVLEKSERESLQEECKSHSANRFVKKTGITATSSRLMQKPAIKKSELMRKLEAKQKAVINNKEEMIKIKAERARRDREERAQRVLQNNKKKEEQREATLKVMRQRELAIEELHRQQASPIKVPKNYTRTNSKSPSRLHLLQCASTKPQINLPSFSEMRKGTSQSREYEGLVSSQLNPLKRKATAASPAVLSKRATVYPEDVTSKCNNSHPILEELDKNYRLPQSKDDLCADTIDSNDVEAAKTVSSTTDIAPIAIDSKEKFIDQSKLFAGGDLKTGGNVLLEAGELHKNMGTLEREKEEAREKLGILDSSQLNNKNLMNVTACSSYELSPPKKHLPSTEDNYNIDDLSSGDETDEEDNPKKKIPSWAQPVNLRHALREQASRPLHLIDNYFGQIETPDLNKIFSIQRSRYAKRTSSALWNSPLANPREGVSMYYALQKQK